MRLIALLFLLHSVCAAQTVVPAAGNTWFSKATDTGLSASRTYVWVSPGSLEVVISASVEQTTEVTAGLVALGSQAESRIVRINPGTKEHVAGAWTVDQEGYVEIVISHLTSDELVGLQLSGTAVNDRTAFVRNNEGNFFYWGRRGPSVHLRFDLQGRTDIEWFYSEITVPEKNDVIGSYYMANGFSDGYFGFQVNSETERRILFSVWSPFQTDDPKSIPEEDRIVLMKRGEDVYTGEFGNEGSGGQSYWRYAWKAGTTYGFLLRAQPEGANTIYTAWFFAPELDRWKLIASWRRPKKATYLTNLYSFLENFDPETGNRGREAHYGNEWVRDKEGRWIELTQARFTGDNTARKNYRKDYAGGLYAEDFFLWNCGFFSVFNSPLDRTFVRPATKKAPSIKFKSLP